MPCFCQPRITCAKEAAQCGRSKLPTAPWANDWSLRQRAVHTRTTAGTWHLVYKNRNISVLDADFSLKGTPNAQHPRSSGLRAQADRNLSRDCWSPALRWPRQCDSNGSSAGEEIPFLHLSHSIDTEVMTAATKRGDSPPLRTEHVQKSCVPAGVTAAPSLGRTRLSRTDGGVTKFSLFTSLPHTLPSGEPASVSQRGRRSQDLERQVQNLPPHPGRSQREGARAQPGRGTRSGRSGLI